MAVRQLFDRQSDLRLSDQGEHDTPSEAVWIQLQAHGQIHTTGKGSLINDVTQI